MPLQIHAEIISHFPLHQQVSSGFQNPGMLLLDFFFSPLIIYLFLLFISFLDPLRTIGQD